MKKDLYFYLVSMLFLFIVGACSSGGDDIPDPEPKPESDKVTTNKSSENVTVEGITTNVTITANKAWTASSDQSWCTVSPASGNAGTATLTITVTANPDEQERSATVTIKAGTASATITVKQAKKEAEADEVTTDKTSEDVSAEGATTNVTITTNKAWTASSNQSWCTVSPASGNAGTATLTITVTANPDEQERTATVTIKAGTASATITVKQAKKETSQGGEEENKGSNIEDMGNKQW